MPGKQLHLRENYLASLADTLFKKDDAEMSFPRKSPNHSRNAERNAYPANKQENSICPEISTSRVS